MHDKSIEIVDRLVDSGLDEKEARVVVALSGRSPLKASEIGALVQISRMDSYNTLKRLQEKGIISATVDKPMRFASKPLSEVFELLIMRRAVELKRVQGHLVELAEGPEAIFLEATASEGEAEPRFTVVKDRSNITTAVARFVDDAEDEVWLTLGKWGILHLNRSGGIRTLNAAAERGIRVRIIAEVEHRTLRFYKHLNAAIEVRHTPKSSLFGALVDDDVAVHGIVVDWNPVGRGRDDSALIIEAPGFMAAQKELLRNTWESGTPLAAMAHRLESGKIVEPLQLNIGEGSFYDRLKNLVSDEANQGSPKDIGWTNAILRVGEEGETALSIPAFDALGIDVSHMLRTIGRRVGEEMALEIEADLGPESDEEFWDLLASHWQKLGKGRLTYEGAPPQLIRVDESGSQTHSPDMGGEMCHLDEGILEGIILSRHQVEVKAVERECTSSGKNHCEFDILA